MLVSQNFSVSRRGNKMKSMIFGDMCGENHTLHIGRADFSVKNRGAADMKPYSIKSVRF